MAFKYGFLTYLSRSGSTFLSNLLNNYEEVCVTLEGGLPPELLGVKNHSLLQLQSRSALDSYFSYLIKHARIESWNLNLEACRGQLGEESFPVTGVDIVENLLKTYRDHHKPEAQVVLYKGVPFLPWMAGEVLHNFPQALVIHLIRDPRAVYNSQKNLPLPYENRDFVYNAYQTISEWKKAVNATAAKPGAGMAGDQLISINYEDLILHPDGTQQRIRSFIGVSDNHSDKNNFSAKIPEEEQQLHTYIDSEPREDRIAKWKQKLERKDIAIIELGLAGLLESCGYSNHIDKKTPADRLRLWKSHFSYRIYTVWYRIARILKGVVSDPKSYVIKFKSRFL